MRSVGSLLCSNLTLQLHQLWFMTTTLGKPLHLYLLKYNNLTNVKFMGSTWAARVENNYNWKLNPVNLHKQIKRKPLNKDWFYICMSYGCSQSLLFSWWKEFFHDERILSFLSILSSWKSTTIYNRRCWFSKVHFFQVRSKTKEMKE